MYFLSWDFSKPKPDKKKPLCAHFYSCTFCNLLLNTAGRKRNANAEPTWALQYTAGLLRVMSFRLLSKPPLSFPSSSVCCSILWDSLHDSSVKQADLVQFNRELWEIRVWIRTVREKYSAEGPPFLFSLITLTSCKNRLSRYFPGWACGWGGQIRATESLSAVSVL